MKNFLTRTVTGLFLVLFVLGGFLLHPLSYAAVGLIIIVGSQVELSELLKGSDARGSLLKSLLISITAYILSFLVASGNMEYNVLFIIALIVVVIASVEIYSRGKNHFERISVIVFSSLFVAMPYILMLFTAFGSEGRGTLLGHNMGLFSPLTVVGFFVLLWINDSGAYLTGVLFGKHRLFERISPKKSWEGFAGGVVFTLLGGWAIGTALDLLSVTNWVITGLIVSLGSTYGDLFESLLKREAGVKDSGKILPGHGGFLDRFDGVTFSFPVVYLYLSFFG